MAKNKIQMNKQIFHILLESAREKGVHIENATEGRWIKTSDEYDRELLVGLTASNFLTLTRQRKAAFFDYKDKRFLAVSDFPVCDIFPRGIESVQITAGMYIPAILSLEIDPIATGSEIKEAIELQYKGCPDGYGGHELQEISQLFPDIKIFEADKNYNLSDDIIRALGALICCADEDWPVRLDAGTLEKIKTIFEGGSDHIPYHNVLQGLVAISWTNLYLEIYRCIEHLYFVPRIKKLKEALSLGGRIQDISRHIEKTLTWRPKEQEALRSLIKECDENVIVSIIKSFGKSVNENPEEDPEKESNRRASIDSKAAELIYDLRNDIVHFRPINEIVRKDHKDWNNIISSMCEITVNLYGKYDAILTEEEAIISEALQPSQ